jgi:hypothetical protein
MRSPSWKVIECLNDRYRRRRADLTIFSSRPCRSVRGNAINISRDGFLAENETREIIKLESTGV